MWRGPIRHFWLQPQPAQHNGLCYRLFDAPPAKLPTTFTRPLSHSLYLRLPPYNHWVLRYTTISSLTRASRLHVFTPAISCHRLKALRTDTFHYIAFPDTEAVQVCNGITFPHLFKYSRSPSYLRLWIFKNYTIHVLFMRFYCFTVFLYHILLAVIL